MHETSRHITPHETATTTKTIFTPDTASPDSIDDLDELGNITRSSRTTDDLGNVRRDTRRDSSPDDRCDPDFSYGGGGRENSDLF